MLCGMVWLNLYNGKMETSKILEGNKLIAEFMHSKGEEGGYWWYAGNPTDNAVRIMYTEYSAKYHSSWDWLMPVVEKCFAVYDTVESAHSNHQFVLNDAILTLNIDEIWKTVVWFIEWYNGQK